MINELDATVNKIRRLANKLGKGIHHKSEICSYCGAHKENYREMLEIECEEAHPWTKERKNV